MKKFNKKSHSKFGMDATTTSKDWGFIPIPGKGGKSTNSEIGESMIHRELKEMDKK